MIVQMFGKGSSRQVSLDLVASVVNDEPIRYLSARTILADSWGRDTMFANDMPAKLLDTSVFLGIQTSKPILQSCNELGRRLEVNLLH